MDNLPTEILDWQIDRKCKPFHGLFEFTYEPREIDGHKLKQFYMGEKAVHLFPGEFAFSTLFYNCNLVITESFDKYNSSILVASHFIPKYKPQVQSLIEEIQSNPKIKTIGKTLVIGRNSQIFADTFCQLGIYTQSIELPKPSSTHEFFSVVLFNSPSSPGFHNFSISFNNLA